MLEKQDVFDEGKNKNNTRKAKQYEYRIAFLGTKQGAECISRCVMTSNQNVVTKEMVERIRTDANRMFGFESLNAFFVIPINKIKAQKDIFCPDCGHRLNVRDNFCSNCGKQIREKT